MTDPSPKLRGVSDLREFFRTNQTPVYFVSPTAFNLLGIDRWVRNFHYVTYFDSFEGSHPNVFVPADRSMTNVTAGAYADLPLFLFHLLEYLDVDYEVDIGEINERWSREASVDVWSQIIIKETADPVELLTQAPPTGIYHLSKDEAVAFRRWGHDWHGISGESEAFYLRILAPGDYRYRGADLGALVTRGRLQTDDNRLEDRCQRWITGIRAKFAGTPIVRQTPEAARPPSFKMA